MKLIPKIVTYNLIHLAMILLTNFLFLAMRTFITKEVDSEILKENYAYQLVAVFFFTFLTAITMALPVVIGFLLVIEVVNIAAYAVVHWVTRDKLKSLIYSSLIMAIVMLPLYYYVCIERFKIPFYFWVGYGLLLLTEYLKYRKYNKTLLRQASLETTNPV